MFVIDPLYYVVTAPALLFALYAQLKVKMTYSRYSRVRTATGMTGAEAADRILRDSGIDNVRIGATQGWLSDHYDPRSRTLNLSPDVYAGRSIASVGVAAHEAGHAIQHAMNYKPMAVRHAMVPLAMVGPWLSYILIIAGALMAMMGLVKLGIVIFCGIIAFQLVTLPVEFNASTRAKAMLQISGIVTTPEEADGVNRVLSAAALTYVAAVVASVLTLLYYLMRLGLLGGRSDD